jgi:ribokinase
LPRSGETLAGHAFHLGFGGKGANQAIMARRLGASVALIAALGDDTFGREYLRHFEGEGLDSTHVRFASGHATGAAAIIVDDEARNCILVVPGANLCLTPHDVRAAAAAIQNAGVVLCQLEVPLESTVEAFRLARAFGVRTILNPAPALPLSKESLRLADLCIPNETEIGALTGKPADTIEAAAEATRALQSMGAKSVIVTLGERGALIADGEGVYPITAAPVAALDPTGAGDAFIGSLAVFWSEGQSLREAATKASAVAALTVTRQGAQASFPTRGEVEKFLDGRAGMVRAQ